MNTVHYYGDIVRRLFIASAFIMAATLPFFSANIEQPILMSIMGILVLGVAAGLTSPSYASSAIINVLIAIVSVAVFEGYAVVEYKLHGANIFFIANQTMALIFLSALYYGVKTIRGRKEGSQ